MNGYRKLLRRGAACCAVLLVAGCSEPSAPETRGSFEAEFHGPFDLLMRGDGRFAQTDTTSPISFEILLAKTLRDATYKIVMQIPTARPAQGVYSILGGTAESPGFQLSVVICASSGSCSTYVPHDGLINLTTSSATKVSGVFNAVVEHSDPAITQEIFVDGEFDAVCDPKLLHPAVAFCR